MITLRVILSRIGYLVALLPLLSATKIFNAAKAFVFFLLRTEKSVKSPPIMIVSVTSRCNYKCVMCWVNDSPADIITNYRDFFDMDFEFLESVLREHARYLCIVRLHGGEPLYHREILRVIDLLNELKIPFNAVTNGSCLTEEMCRKLVNSYCIGISVSLDAATPDTYSFVRRGGKFENVVANIETLIDVKKKTGSKRPVIGISMCAYSFNVGEMAELAKFCADHGIRTLTTSEGSDLQTKDVLKEHLISNNVDLAYDSIRKASMVAKEHGVKLRTRFPSISGDRYKGIPYHAGNMQPRNCLNLYTTFWLQPDFEVIGCSHVSASAGNLRTTPFAELWNSKNHWYAQARRSFRNKKTPEACGNCGYTGGFFS